MNYENRLEMNYMDLKPILTKLKNGLLLANTNLVKSDFGSKIKREHNYQEFYLYKNHNNCFDNKQK